jgi:hypothetical protein
LSEIDPRVHDLHQRGLNRVQINLKKGHSES